jgi:hypothetical protein
VTIGWAFFLCFPFYYHFYAIVEKKEMDYCFDAKVLEGKLRVEHVVDCGSTSFEGKPFRSACLMKNYLRPPLLSLSLKQSTYHTG